jgi:hypothetical protein
VSENLEEKHTGVPDGWRSAEERKDVLYKDELDLEQRERR